MYRVVHLLHTPVEMTGHGKAIWLQFPALEFKTVSDKTKLLIVKVFYDTIGLLVYKIVLLLVSKHKVLTDVIGTIPLFV